MNSAPTVTILMATYNGEKYIRQQLDSLLGQSYKNWNLIIRDDGSTDNTVSVIREYVNHCDNISLHINTSGQRGACANFSALFCMVKEDEYIKYIMFCDQDDIWKPDKIEVSLQAILQEEKLHKNEPILIYSDLELMDEDGSPIKDTLKLKHKIDLRNLVAFNYVYGCTMMMNRNMIHKIGSIPSYAINHDYWIALVASIYKSSFIDKKLIRYRMHRNNASGNVAGNNSWLSRFKRHVTAPEMEINNSRGRLLMLKRFLDLYRNSLAETDKTILTDYLEAYSKDRLQVCYTMLSHKIFKKGFFQSLTSFYQVLFFYRRIRI